MHKTFLVGFVSLVLWLFVGANRADSGEAASEPGGHVFGEWPAINAMIQGEKQNNLNPEDQDFLIEVWFKPLPKVKAKGDSVNTLVSKKLGDKYEGYDFVYTPSGGLRLAVCDESRELETDLEVGAEGGIKDNAWYYAAAVRSGDKLRLYKDGALLKEFKAEKLGRISNRNVFNVGLGSQGSQAHCEIREVRFWRLKKGETANFDTTVSGHGSNPGTVSADLAAKSDYSRWIFGRDGETVKDIGNNGNTLMYVPFGYHEKDEIAIKPFPEKPSGKTYYVDAANPVASDANSGDKDKPFMTIKRGLKQLRPGDVLHICKGRYLVRERLFMPRGENGNPVTIEGEEGTVLYGAEPVKGWEKSDGDIWILKEWKGTYFPPIDVKEWDARSHPWNVLFMGDDIMDYVKTKTDLVPNSWNVEPVEGKGPKTIYLRTLPGVDPNNAGTEITVCPGMINAGGFNHIRNLHFTRAAGGVSLYGRGNLLENSRIDWLSGTAFGFPCSQDVVVRNNIIEWTGGVGGASARAVIEKNVFRFNSWMILDGGWGGGTIKLIPSNIDNVLRGNEFAYNRTVAVWYDTANNGNVIEDNIMHNNHGNGVFDEFNFGNTIRGNLIYNNGRGLYIANTCSDTVSRNICFNNLSDGIGLRGATANLRKQADPAKGKQLADEIMAKLDVRRYQGMLTYDREKPYRDMWLKYSTEYDDHEICRHNTFSENVLFDNGDGTWDSQVGYRLPYGKPGVTVDPDAESIFRKNYYWSSTVPKETFEADMKKWQEISKQDVGSQYINPWDKDKMPKWYREKMPFAEGQMRPYRAIVDLTGGEVRKFNLSRLLLRGRLAESKFLKVVDFESAGVRGAYFDTEGKRCLALWSRGGMGIMDWVLPAGQKEVIVENKWLNRKTIKTNDGLISILVTDDQTTLIGLSGEIREDKTVTVQVPAYNEPAKPIIGKICLENQGETELDYNLLVKSGKAFTCSISEIKCKLPAQGRKEFDFILERKEGTAKGSYQVDVEGTAGNRNLKKTKGFVLGTKCIALKKQISVDGNISDWDTQGIQAEVADTKEQILRGKDKWKGPADLSAKIRTAWSDDYQMYVVIEVTDDKLVTNHRKDKPLESDSVKLFVDVRTPWKLYINDIGEGAFQLNIVPGNDDNPEPTVEYIGPMIAHQKNVITKKTDKGYIVEVRLRFRNIDDPGWVAGREFRIGALVNDSDDAESGKKSVLGLWGTAMDADKNCATWTRFTLEK